MDTLRYSVRAQQQARDPGKLIDMLIAACNCGTLAHMIQCSRDRAADASAFSCLHADKGEMPSSDITIDNLLCAMYALRSLAAKVRLRCVRRVLSEGRIHCAAVE